MQTNEEQNSFVWFNQIDISKILRVSL